jgi:hypothetical protein
MAYYRNQGEINEDSHRANMDAARRRIDRDALRAITDPGRFNPWERRALQNYAQETDLLGREDKLREHEKDMVDRKGAIEKDVAKINADKDVAIGKLRFGFEDEKGVRHEGSDVLTERERQLGAEKLGQLQFGSYDENGNYKPGSSVLTEREKGISGKTLAEQQGKNALALEQQRGKTAKEVAEISGNAQVDAAEATAAGTATAKERARQERYAQREQRDYENWRKSGIEKLKSDEKAAFLTMSPGEQKEFWRKKMGRAAAGNGSQGGGSNWKNLGW